MKISPKEETHHWQKIQCGRSHFSFHCKILRAMATATPQPGQPRRPFLFYSKEMPVRDTHIGFRCHITTHESFYLPKKKRNRDARG